MEHLAADCNWPLLLAIGELHATLCSNAATEKTCKHDVWRVLATRRDVNTAVIEAFRQHNARPEPVVERARKGRSLAILLSTMDIMSAAGRQNVDSGLTALAAMATHHRHPWKTIRSALVEAMALAVEVAAVVEASSEEAWTALRAEPATAEAR
jgi:hypothetical protein